MADTEIKEIKAILAELAKDQRKTELAQQKTEAALAELAKEHRKTEVAQQKTEVAQQKTEAALAELAKEHRKTEVAQQKTEVAQQKTEAALAELAKEHRKTEVAQQKTEAALAELAKEHRKTEVAQQKTEAALAELAKEHRKTEVAQQKTELAQQKTEVALAEMAKELGGIGNTQGEIAEDLFYRNLEPLMQERGIKLTSISQRVKAISGREYDSIGMNGTYVAIVEVKSKVSNRNLENLINKQIPAFRIDFPQYKNHKIIACIAGLVMKKEVEKKANSLGLFVLTQKGKGGAQIANAPGFKAKLY